MTMFKNRTHELEILEKSWQSPGAELIICYGRRRVGKTEIIKRFLENRSGLYFLADRLSEKENLRVLTRLAADFFQDPFLAEFPNWYTFFDYLQARVSHKIVIVIDEFPYLVETNKAISSVFQKGWDETLRKLPIVFILCGSSLGMMERETLAYGAPLYGRRTGQMLIRPLGFADFSLFFPGAGFDRRLEIFAISGGIPAYIKQFDDKLSLRRNVIEHVLEPDAYLFGDAEFILKEETREPRQYFSILRAIALGKHKLGEIVNETGIDKSSLHKYLYYLEELRIIEKRFPSTEEKIEKSRQGLYYLSDNYFSFWFDIVFPYRSELALGNKRPALARFDRAFVHHAAQAYEEAGAEILRRFQAELFPFSRVGKWWRKNEEIDLVAIDEKGHDLLCAEAKWSSKKIGTDIYEDLKRKSMLLPGYDKRRRFALLSRAGFTPAMQRIAKAENVLLIHGEQKV
jgi:AAA+ ATPase superfamily predicted ATPase